MNLTPTGGFLVMMAGLVLLMICIVVSRPNRFKPEHSKKWILNLVLGVTTAVILWTGFFMMLAAEKTAQR